MNRKYTGTTGKKIKDWENNPFYQLSKAVDAANRDYFPHFTFITEEDKENG